ncbi:MAG: hypothetical protein WBA67_13770 [Jannaschia sp.]
MDPPAGSQAGSPANTGFDIVPAIGGLDIEGSGGLEIGFGRDASGVLESIGRIDGRMPVPIRCEGSGLSGYAADDGLVIVFADQRFVGWQMKGARAGRSCG